MGLFDKRNKQATSPTAIWFGSGDCAPAGYRRLLDAPEVAACVALAGHALALGVEGLVHEAHLRTDRRRTRFSVGGALSAAASARAMRAMP